MSINISNSYGSRNLKVKNSRIQFRRSALILGICAFAFSSFQSFAQTCPSGSATSSTAYGYIAWGGSSHAQNAEGTFLASGTALNPGNSALLQNSKPLIVDMQRLVAEGASQIAIASARFNISGTATATVEYSLNGTTWASLGSALSVSSNNSTYTNYTVPAGGLRYIRITSTSVPGDPILIDGIRSTHYCGVPVSSRRALRSFYAPGSNNGTLATDVYPANAQPLQFSTVIAPSNGSWTLNSSTGTYSYIPNINYDGIELAYYRVCDGGADGNLATTGDNVCETDTLMLKAIFNCDTNVFYVPVPENEALEYLSDINSGNDDPLNVFMGLSVTSDAIVIYDHWEDGFEANPRNPTQSTTQIWGDADLSNGIAPGFSNDILPSGSTSILENRILETGLSGASNPNASGADNALQNVVDYDGKDRILIHGIGALSKLSWGTSGTVSINGVGVPRTEFWGTNYTLPVGQNTANQSNMFEVASISITADENSTVVNIDHNRDGTNDITTTLNKGETYYLDSRSGTGGAALGVNEGGTISANKKIMVVYMTGDLASSWEGRSYSLIPNSQMSSSYTTPGIPREDIAVYVYNPDPTNSITVTEATNGSSTTFTVPANSSVRRTYDASSKNDNSNIYTSSGGAASRGYTYSTSGSPAPRFLMIGTADRGNADSDWGFLPVSQSNLQQIMLMSLGFGADPNNTTYYGSSASSPRNFEQLMVTPVANTHFYVDLNGDGNPDKVSFNNDLDATDNNITIDGITYDETTSDLGISVQSLRTLTISSTTGDMSGAVVWTKTGPNNPATYGANFAAVWGQNDGVAGSGNIDAGYTIPPKMFPPLNNNIRINYPDICNGSTTDSIHINITNGTPPYRIQWINLRTGANSVYTFNTDSTKIASISPGRFLIKVRDADCLFFTREVDLVEKVVNCATRISGTVFHDSNGLSNNLLDGSGIYNPEGTQLYVYLDSQGLAVQKVQLPVSGSYLFLNVAQNSNYTVVVSAQNINTGLPSPSGSNLPTNWAHTAEQFGLNNNAGTGFESGASNGRISVNTGASIVSSVNFGIEKRPESNPSTAAAQYNPGGLIRVAVPTLSGSDLEDGTLNNSSGDTIVVTSLPANGNLYYNGVLVSLGRVINNYNATLFAVDPLFNGVGTVVFTYSWKDAAGLQDLSPATVTIPFTSVGVSGVIYHDANGNSDLTISGLPKGRINPRIVVYIIDSASNLVLDSVHVNELTGTYSSNVLNSNSTYFIQISTDSVAIGQIGPAATMFPLNWIPVIEQFGVGNAAGTGIESTPANGRIKLVTGTTDITALNFGIEVRPIAHNKFYLVSPDSIKGITGLNTFTHFLFLNHPSGTTDTNENSNIITIKPGMVSGADYEDGRFDGVTGVGNSSIVFRNLPDTNNAILVYRFNGQNIFLWPAPTVSNPSFVWWNIALNQYEIPSFESDSLLMFFKMAGQSVTTFNYAYKDAAGITGLLGQYLLSYTIPLPVILNGVFCEQQNNATKLSWQLIEPSGIEDMVLLFSNNGKPFTELVRIKKTSEKPEFQNYSYMHRDAPLGYNIYKVLANTKDGIKYSSDYCNSINQNKPENVSFNISPNPTIDMATLLIQSPESCVFKIEITDNSGRLISTSVLTVDDYISSKKLDFTNLAAGIYNVKLAWNSESTTLRVLKQ
jgi:hypothetical protein